MRSPVERPRMICDFLFKTVMVFFFKNTEQNSKNTKKTPFFSDLFFSIAFKLHKKTASPVISGRNVEMIPKRYKNKTGGGR